MNHPYVNELIASYECEGDARKVVCIGDSGQKGTDVYWCEETGKWVCVDLDFPGQTVTCEEIALVRLHEDADPEEGISQRALACDFEREKGLWLIDAEELEELAVRYVAALEVLWSSKTQVVAHRVS
jgi:hypothetical protein